MKELLKLIWREKISLRLSKEPVLKSPDMLACWPGIGNVGISAIDTLRGQLKAEEFGEIEPWHFLYPWKVVIRDSVLQGLEFPHHKFYFRKLRTKDLVFFIGEEQPAPQGMAYSRGRKAYELAHLVLDVAGRLGCRRIYSLGAAVAPIHHTTTPRVWVAANNWELAQELEGYRNTVLMSKVGGIKQGQSITGLNGLLPALAKTRGIAGACIMGEVPDYLARVHIPCPRASRAVMEVLASLLGLEIDYTVVDEVISQTDKTIEQIYEQAMPQNMKEQIEQRKSFPHSGEEPIKDEDQEWIKEHIDELFKKGKGNE